MRRRTPKNDVEGIIYAIGIFCVIAVLGSIIEYIVPIFIICAIIGAIIGIIALLKSFGVIKPIQIDHLKKQSKKSSKNSKNTISNKNNSYTYVPTKRQTESTNDSEQQKKATSNSNSYTYASPKQSTDTPKENKTYQAQAPVTWEVKYKVAEDLPAENVNYRRKPLLTDHERKFYYSLAPIAKKYDLCVLSKIRIADLVEPTAHAYRERSEYFHYFGKIKAKHIDFALCDPADLEIKLLIELDDWTHGTTKGRERDEFVEEVYRDTGYRLLRVYDPWSLEQKIREALDITEEYKIKTP